MIRHPEIEFAIKNARADAEKHRRTLRAHIEGHLEKECAHLREDMRAVILALLEQDPVRECIARFQAAHRIIESFDDRAVPPHGSGP